MHATRTAPFVLYCRDIDALHEPAFFKSLPPCVAQAMPRFVSWAKDVRQRSDYPPAGAGDTRSVASAGGGSSKLLLLLLLALLAAGAAVVATAVRGSSLPPATAWGTAWRRRRQPARRSNGAAAAQDAEGIELLQHGAAVAHNGGARHRQIPQSPRLAHGRARLKALVQRQLGGTALLSGRPEAEVLHMLNHTAHSFAVAVADGPLPAVANSVRRGGASVRLVQHWGLPTESLRMPAAELQVGASGGLLLNAMRPGFGLGWAHAT